MEGRSVVVEIFVWVNNVFVYFQSVVKVKYEFLFGRVEGKILDISDYGGSILFLLNVINEFLEYGIMEEGGDGLRVFLEFDGEILLCYL